MSVLLFAAEPPQNKDLFAIAQVHYHGGGDWYEDKTSLVRLLARLKKDFGISVVIKRKEIELTDENLFSYPMLFMTGHGNVVFSDEEVKALRTYLTNGGFLWVCDDYGMDVSFRREMKKVFPEQGHQLFELPLNYEIYNIFYKFTEGLPKIHEHAGGAPRGYGIEYNQKLVVFYDFNTDIGDGLENPSIHKDQPEKQEQAFKMAVNIVLYAITH